MADRDRQRVYDAEDGAFLDTSYASPLGQRGCRWLVAQLAATPWWSALGWGEPILRAARADSTTSTSRVDTGRPELRIAPGMDQAHVLSHELGHVVSGPEAGHGPIFRAAHADVAVVLLGSHGAARLRQGYARGGLDPAVRTWPPPPYAGEGGLLAVWEARQVIEAFRRRSL